MSASLSCHLFMLGAVSQTIVLQVDTRWLGEGTTADLQEVVMGRCYNYIRVVNPSVGEKNCSAIWSAFREAFIYRDPCTALFWEKNKRLVHRYSDVTRRMMPLGETLIGWLGDDLTWCGSATGDGLDHVSCPTTTECESNPVESFWRVASTAYANLSSGVIQVMLNGSVTDGTFPENSESCGTNSVRVLQQILTEEGFTHTCTDNYRAVRMLQCVDHPSHPVCLCRSAAPPQSLLFLHPLHILLTFLYSIL
ncbi:hypothetical protein JZ751_018834 [Albula glossodonta]|uniref:ADP-ribosyl cyclase/cyclic ADP-ribose hydrolase n=1 Tax=Albula glossodonta TaxID=121402 RepID=A0A8T2N1I7_9TELE|nr:hypothetical protein JZ751_018834 [Albula glossodonta]